MLKAFSSSQVSKDDADIQRVFTSHKDLKSASVQSLAAAQKKREEEIAQWSTGRRACAKIVESRYYEVFMGLIVLANAGLIIADTDHRASGAPPDIWSTVVANFFLLTYTIDISLRLWAFRGVFFESKFNYLDLVVILSDIIVAFLSFIVYEGPSLSIFRIFRLARLLRFVHVLVLFRELHVMLAGFMSAMKAIFWASFMLGIMLTLWSIVAVEVLHPINMRLAARGLYEGCERCPRAFSSVVHSNLTFMQQIIAGDSWGLVSIPIIEEEPATVVLFFAVLITINLGLLNLVLTVIVDAASEAREADETRRLLEKTFEFESAKVKFLKLCEELDEDHNGELSFDELLEGMHSNPRFAQTMAVLDVSRDDMHIIFNMLDEDSSGTVTYSEFVEQLHKIKSQDTHTMLIFIKGYLHEIRTRMTEQMRVIQKDLGGATKQLLAGLNGILFGVFEHEEEVVDTSLQVKIQSAEGLRKADVWGLSDPYCVCEVEGKPNLKFQTPCMRNTLTPVWNCERSIEGVDPEDGLVFTLWDKDQNTADDLLGCAKLTAEQLRDVENNEFTGELEIEYQGKPAGTLQVTVVLPNDPNWGSESRAGPSSGKNGRTSQTYRFAKADSMELTSLRALGEYLEKLSQRLDIDLARVLQDGSEVKDMMSAKPFSPKALAPDPKSPKASAADPRSPKASSVASLLSPEAPAADPRSPKAPPSLDEEMDPPLSPQKLRQQAMSGGGLSSCMGIEPPEEAVSPKIRQNSKVKEQKMIGGVFDRSSASPRYNIGPLEQKMNMPGYSRV